MKKRIVTVIGTRPQYIKYAALSTGLRERFDETLVDTGQHYDTELSEIFLDEFQLAVPDYTFQSKNDNSLSQIATIIIQLQSVLDKLHPDALLCFGDTNSTLAAALAGVKCGIPVIHIEAGERNFTQDNVRIPVSATPEETNRVLTDHVSSLLLCASQRGFGNLIAESVTGRIVLTGDVLFDLFLHRKESVFHNKEILNRIGVKEGEYLFCTVHRAINTTSPRRLQSIFTALSDSGSRVIVALHPRTQRALEEYGLSDFVRKLPGLQVIQPVSHRDSLVLIKYATCVATDSGGIMREAFFCGVRSVCLDDSTAWLDIVLSGWSILAGATTELIHTGLQMQTPEEQPPLFGNGTAIARTLESIQSFLS